MEKTVSSPKIDKLAPMMLEACIAALKNMREKSSIIDKHRNRGTMTEQLMGEDSLIYRLENQVVPLKLVLEQILEVPRDGSLDNYYHYSTAINEINSIAPIVLEEAISMVADIATQIRNFVEQKVEEASITFLVQEEEKYRMLMVVLEKVLETKRL